eukprot:m.14448 g.14448  ORF g.14448 m.14448 type:complete len:449 (+) comp5097_c0_seq1:104-1450(+)
MAELQLFLPGDSENYWDQLSSATAIGLLSIGVVSGYIAITDEIECDFWRNETVKSTCCGNEHTLWRPYTIVSILIGVVLEVFLLSKKLFWNSKLQTFKHSIRRIFDSQQSKETKYERIDKLNIRLTMFYLWCSGCLQVFICLSLFVLALIFDVLAGKRGKQWGCHRQYEWTCAKKCVDWDIKCRIPCDNPIFVITIWFFWVVLLVATYAYLHFVWRIKAVDKLLALKYSQGDQRDIEYTAFISQYIEDNILEEDFRALLDDCIASLESLENKLEGVKDKRRTSFVMLENIKENITVPNFSSKTSLLFDFATRDALLFVYGEQYKSERRTGFESEDRRIHRLECCIEKKLDTLKGLVKSLQKNLENEGLATALTNFAKWEASLMEEPDEKEDSTEPEFSDVQHAMNTIRIRQCDLEKEMNELIQEVQDRIDACAKLIKQSGPIIIDYTQ